jgi:hypothetical protein
MADLAERKPGLQALIQDVLGLTQAHPDKFAVKNVSNDWHSAVNARTLLIGPDGDSSELVVQISKRPDEINQSVELSRNGEHVYRLDQTSGEQAVSSRQSTLELMNEWADEYPDSVTTLSKMLANYSVDADGNVIEYSDNFGETKIPYIEVQSLLANSSIELPPLKPGEITLDQLKRNDELLSA